MSTATILIFPHRIPPRDTHRARFDDDLDPLEDVLDPSRASSDPTDDLKPEPTIDEIFTSLTKREWAVLWLLAEGLSDREIAVRLNVGRETVRTHMAGLLRKLGAESRLEALVIAVRHDKVRIR